jgi:hypothetical protein
MVTWVLLDGDRGGHGAHALTAGREHPPGAGYPFRRGGVRDDPDLDAPGHGSECSF